VTFPVVRFVYGGVEQGGGGAGRPWTVVYDGTCKVCNRLVGVLNAWDRANEIETVPYQNSSVLSRFPWIPAEAYVEAMQLVGPGGRTWQGAGAVEQLLRVLPAGGLFAWVFRLPYFGRAFERFYNWFARNRYKFGCGEHCQARPLKVEYGDEAAPER
jgi:predicted DCC family thiol-disulfide oxidoreductase YuxK